MYSKIAFSKGKLSLEQMFNDRTPFGFRQTVSPSHTIPKVTLSLSPRRTMKSQSGVFFHTPLREPKKAVYSELLFDT